MFDVIWERGLDVLATVVNTTTKTITAMLGSSAGEETESANAEWWQHVGFSSRPSNPTKGSASAQVITLKGTDVDAAIASRDIRGQAIYGNLGPGETCVYATGANGTGQARVLLKTDGSINLYTRAGNTSSGNGMAIMLTPSNDSFSLTTGAGMAIVATADGLKLTAGDASLSLNADGTIKLVGKGQVQVDGSTVVIGSVAVPVVSAALKGPTGVAGVASLKVLVE